MSDRTADLVKIDLHMHTTVSDGSDTPEQLLDFVRKEGIRLFSVTDHDAVKAGRIIPALLKKGDPDLSAGRSFPAGTKKASTTSSDTASIRMRSRSERSWRPVTATGWKR